MSHPAGPRTGRSPARADRGMVATSHDLATQAGVHALRRGGSAVDAAIAANAVLCVTYPHMAGMGGDGFWLIHDGQAMHALNASGPAGAGATREWYAEQGITDSIPTRGGVAANTVPGAVDGWREAHERFGRLDWSSLFDDAIHWARAGAPVERSLTEWAAEDVPDLQGNDEAARIFLPGGKAPRDGDRLVNEDLARSFEQVAEGGGRALYEGSLAERLAEGAQAAGSSLTADDLARFRAEWVEPLSVDYRGVTAWELPPNTQGFAALQILKMIEGFDVASWGDLSFEYFQHLAEAVKLSFADRNAWLTDPGFVDIPLDRLLSEEYLAERRDQISTERSLVMEEVDPGIDVDPSTRRHGGPGGDTCYFCVVDGDGLAASVIQSIYHDFGSCVVPPGTGIILQNRGAFFSLDDDHPNRLEPGKRTFHTLIPAMLTRDGKPWLVYGTMGGEGQPQTHAALVTRIVDFGYDVQQAIEAPRWLMGRTWGAESQDLWLEGRVPDQVARQLQLVGQPVKLLTDWADDMGHAQAIRIHDNGLLEGGADPRGDGSAAGY